MRTTPEYSQVHHESVCASNHIILAALSLAYKLNHPRSGSGCEDRPVQGVTAPLDPLGRLTIQLGENNRWWSAEDNLCSILRLRGAELTIRTLTSADYRSVRFTLTVSNSRTGFRQGPSLPQL
jgi:hypothetical protein